MKRLADALRVVVLALMNGHKAIEMEEEKNPVDRCREIIAEGRLSMYTTDRRNDNDVFQADVKLKRLMPVRNCRLRTESIQSQFNSSKI